MNAAEPVPPLDDLGMLADLAMAERGRVRWRCPFCDNEVAEEWSPHCGETGQAVPITGDDE